MAPPAYQVTCVRKSDRLNPHERIVSIGGPTWDGTWWTFSQARAIELIETLACRFYVAVPGRESVYLIVERSRYDHKYLRTEADGTQPNYLLRLPECQREA